MADRERGEKPVPEEKVNQTAPAERPLVLPCFSAELPEEDFSYLDTVQKGTGERAGPLYRCLMVTTGQEDYVRQLLGALHLGECIIPRKVRLRRVRGVWTEDEVPLLPGYLFVYERDEVPLWKYQQLINVLRILRYDQEPYGFMKDRDLTFAKTIFEVKGRVKPLEAIDEGDYIRITDGLLKNLNGTVLSVDRHKRQAKIRLQLMGREKIVYMNYVLLEKQAAAAEAKEEPARAKGTEQDAPEGGQTV